MVFPPSVLKNTTESDILQIVHTQEEIEFYKSIMKQTHPTRRPENQTSLDRVNNEERRKLSNGPSIETTSFLIDTDLGLSLSDED